MDSIQVQEVLKNMSGDEIAQTQNAVLMNQDLSDEDRTAAVALIGNELRIRQTEGLGRKAERFWNRHGERVGLVAIGALLGTELSD